MCPCTHNGLAGGGANAPAAGGGRRHHQWASTASGHPCMGTVSPACGGTLLPIRARPALGIAQHSLRAQEASARGPACSSGHGRALPCARSGGGGALSRLAVVLHAVSGPGACGQGGSVGSAAAEPTHPRSRRTLLLLCWGRGLGRTGERVCVRAARAGGAVPSANAPFALARRRPPAPRYTPRWCCCGGTRSTWCGAAGELAAQRAAAACAHICPPPTRPAPPPPAVPRKQQGARRRQARPHHRLARR